MYMRVEVAHSKVGVLVELVTINYNLWKKTQVDLAFFPGLSATSLGMMDAIIK